MIVVNEIDTDVVIVIVVIVEIIAITIDMMIAVLGAVKDIGREIGVKVLIGVIGGTVLTQDTTIVRIQEAKILKEISQRQWNQKKWR